MFRDEQKKIKKRKKVAKSKLSFAVDDEAEEESTTRFKDEEDDNPSKRVKTRKNPNVDTSFLPDRDREEAERREREELRQEWLRKQEEMKKEEIEITYSYWDGSGHRKSVVVKKGDEISTFLDKCKQQIPELRGVSVDNLMYIKEDLIIPHVRLSALRFSPYSSVAALHLLRLYHQQSAWKVRAAVQFRRPRRCATSCGRDDREG